MVIKYELITVTISQNVLKYSFALKSVYISRVMIKNVLSLFIKTPITENLLLNVRLENYIWIGYINVRVIIISKTI